MGRSGQIDLRARLRGSQISRQPVPPVQMLLPEPVVARLLTDTNYAACVKRFLAGEPAVTLTMTRQHGAFQFFWPLRSGDYGQHKFSAQADAIEAATNRLRQSTLGGTLVYTKKPGSRARLDVAGKIAPAEEIDVEIESDGNGITDVRIDGQRIGSLAGEDASSLAICRERGIRVVATLALAGEDLVVTCTPTR